MAFSYRIKKFLFMVFISLLLIADKLKLHKKENE